MPRSALSRLGGCLLAAGLVLPSVVAAQQGPGARLTFGLDTRLEAGRNLALTVPESGSSLLSETRLSFGYLTETRTERLAIDGSGLLRLGRDDGARVSQFDSRRGGISYRRESATALLALDARIFAARVDFLRLPDLIAPDPGEPGDPDPGDPDPGDPGAEPPLLPPDFDDLRGRGTRQNITTSGRLELGRGGPWGLTLTASANLLRYRDVTDPGLVDTDRLTFGARTRLELSPVLTLGLGVQRSLYEADLEPGNLTSVRRRITDRADLTLSYALSERLTASLDLGRNRIDSRRGTGRTVTEGFVGGLGFTLQMPNGTLSGSLREDRTEDGGRRTLRFSRALDLPTGALSGSLGLTRGPAGDTSTVGALFWRRDMPRGALTLRLSREIDSSDPDEGDRLRTLVGLGYRLEVSPVSSVVFGLDHSVTDAVSGEDRRERTDLRATYSHQLTPDWALNSGLRYTTRKDADGSRSTAPSVFIGLGRQFVFGL